MARLPRCVPFLLPVASLAALFLAPRAGVTVPLYAARTGLPCQSCHFDPNGGGPRNEFGFLFAKNRHSLEPETDGAWKDLNLRNRVSDDFPLYFGVNQRFMLLANRQLQDSGVDHVGFWNMENALTTVFQPHPRLTLVYNAEPVSGQATFQSRDAFAMIGLGGEHYLKAGQFRVPFGLRMADHTVATRNSFLDYQGGGRFLPYDPRTVDRGVELGGSHGGLSGRASFTNGSSSTNNSPPTTNRHPQAVAAKLGYNAPSYQGAISVYDDWAPTGTGRSVRSSRWGYYLLTHRGPFAVVGEIAAGTDQAWAAGAVSRRNLLAGFVEADWAPHRAYNVRVRYDRLELDRSSDATTRRLNSWNRWALEGEWVPVPFAELRWTMRLIDPVADRTPLGAEIKNESQAYLQLHVSY